MSDKGNCPKHGEFVLIEGCAQCLADDAKVNSPENIAKRIKESEENLPPGGLAEAARAAGAEVKVVNFSEEDRNVAGAQPNNERLKFMEQEVPTEFKLQIVKVQYISLTTGEISNRDYTYYSVDRLDVGDIITVPIRDTTTKAKVTAIDVPESEIAAFKDKVKTIPTGSRLGKADRGDVVVAEATVLEDGAVDTKINLCDTCTLRNDYPVCSPRDVVFGDGKGNDNIIKCCKYEYGPAVPCTVPLNVEIRPDGKPDPNARRTGEEEESAEKQSGPGGPGANTYGAKPETVADAALVEIDEQGNLVPKAETAVALRPGEDIEVRGHYEEGVRLLEYAGSRVITTLEDNKAASNDLAIISKLKKAMEAKKREYLDPLKAQAEAIRETYIYLMAPVLEAKQVTEKKMLAYNAEQDRIRNVQEEINRKRMEAAQAEAKLKGEDPVPLNLVAVAPETPKSTSTEMGTSSQRDNWKYEVVDLDALPREYMIPDEPMLNAIAKRHHDQKQVSGVRFYNEPIIATRAR